MGEHECILSFFRCLIMSSNLGQFLWDMLEGIVVAQGPFLTLDSRMIPLYKTNYWWRSRVQAFSSFSSSYFFAALLSFFRTLVPQPGVEPAPPAWETWSLNHWTVRLLFGGVQITSSMLYWGWRKWTWENRARLLEMASGVGFSEGLGPVFYCLMAPEKV